MYIHCVWATWDRLPLVTADIKQQIYAVIINECKKMKCTAIAIGGIEDHVHLLAGFPTTITIASLAKQVKGSSSHCVNHVIRPNQFFKWQGSYGAFTVSHSGINRVANYIRNQEDHHKQKSFISHWEI